jgi:hypothetical protein
VCTLSVNPDRLTHQLVCSTVTPGDTSTLQFLASSTTQTSYTYFVNLPVGTEFEFLIKDSTGVQSFTSELVVQSNPTGGTC